MSNFFISLIRSSTDKHYSLRTNEGSNGNQCIGIQGVGNTGNVQNQINAIQYGQGDAGEDDSRRDGDRDRRDRNGGGDGGSFEFDEVNSSIELSPTNTTECTSEVNQAASASGQTGSTW